MREMKDSNVKWIAEIPCTWNVTKIKHHFRIGSGTTPKSDDPEFWDGNIIWVTPADFKTEDIYINKGHRNLSEKGFLSSSLELIPKGNIIFSKRAPIGQVVINSSDLCTNQGCLTAIPKDNSNVRYYRYLMSISTEEFELVSGGTTFKEISANSFGNVRFPRPTDKEQKKIADYLDEKCFKIDSIIEKQQKIIKKLKEYKLSVITEAVTKGLNPDVEMKNSGIDWIGDIPQNWEKVRLGDVTDRIIVGLATSVTPYYRETGTILLRNLNIKEGYLDDSELLYLDESFANNQVGKFIKEKDVLTVHTGSNLGLTCVVPDEYAHTLSFTTLITTPDTNRLNSFFLMYAINSGLGRAEIEKLKCGDIKPNLNVRQFKYFTIFVPPVEEQKEIAKYLNNRIEEIEKSISLKEKMILKMQDYKKSLIYEVVTGKKEV